MQFPLITEYVRAIEEASENLDKLAHLTPVLDNHGEPFRSSGAFAVVFKMKDEQTGKCYALKCFTEDQTGRAEAYQKIAEELDMVDSTYVTSVKYLENEIFVDSTCENEEFPVLLMDWVEGETMETYIANNYQNEHAMSMLCYRFCKLAAWLRSQPFAHGDIKPDNIMVRPDGSLTLVDYDGMFVPAMKGGISPTLGTKDFCHPLRTVNDFDETIDDFSLASIALSLKALSLNPTLLKEFGASDRLIFSADDYRDLGNSKVIASLQTLFNDPDFLKLYALFLLAHSQRSLSMCSFRLFGVEKPKEEVMKKSPKRKRENSLVEKSPKKKVVKSLVKKSPKGKEGKSLVEKNKKEEVLSTKVTNKDLKNAVEDEFGVKYSKDGKRLLRAPFKLDGKYTIKKGTMVICDGAFEWCSDIAVIRIPNSVKSIGVKVFSFCKNLTSIHIPNKVISIGNGAFKDCNNLTSIHIPDSVTSIRNSTFLNCKNLTSIHIPNKLTIIGNSAFKNCKNLTSIHIPNSVTNIENYAFYNCERITSIRIPNSVTSIGIYAFYSCKRIISIRIPNSVTSIGKGAFGSCPLIKSTKQKLISRFGEQIFEWSW